MSDLQEGYPKNVRIRMSVGRKISDNNFGSYNFDVGAEYDIEPGASIGEELTQLHLNLHNQIMEIMVTEGIIEGSQD